MAMENDRTRPTRTTPNNRLDNRYRIIGERRLSFRPETDIDNYRESYRRGRSSRGLPVTYWPLFGSTLVFLVLCMGFELDGLLLPGIILERKSRITSRYCL